MFFTILSNVINKLNKLKNAIIGNVTRIKSYMYCDSK